MDPSSRFTNVLVWEEGKGRGKEGGREERGDKRMEGMTGRRFKAGTGKKKRKKYLSTFILEVKILNQSSD